MMFRLGHINPYLMKLNVFGNKKSEVGRGRTPDFKVHPSQRTTKVLQLQSSKKSQEQAASGAFPYNSLQLIYFTLLLETGPHVL